MKEYQHIGGKHGGIDTSIFDLRLRDREYTARASSGSRVTCKVTENQVCIESVEDKKIAFVATNIDGNLILYVRNTDDQGNRHPDIYPVQLIEHSFEYFNSQGKPVQSIQGSWLPPVHGESSVNHTEYTTRLEGLTDVTAEDRAKAAQNTWTGKVAAALGFTEASVIESEGLNDTIGYVEVQFRKPEEKVVEHEISSEDVSLAALDATIDWEGEDALQARSKVL